MAVKSKKTSAVAAAVEAFDAGDGGSDPDVPVRPGTGTSVSVYGHLRKQEVMGWKLFPGLEKSPLPEGVPDDVETVIWIYKGSPWKVAVDALTKRVYLDIEDTTLKEIEVKGLEYTQEDGTVATAPAKQTCKPDTHYEVILHFKKPDA